MLAGLLHLLLLVMKYKLMQNYVEIALHYTTILVRLKDIC
jgi:hypothetical protein